MPHVHCNMKCKNLLNHLKFVWQFAICHQQLRFIPFSSEIDDGENMKMRKSQKHSISEYNTCNVVIWIELGKGDMQCTQSMHLSTRPQVHLKNSWHCSIIYKRHHISGHVHWLHFYYTHGWPCVQSLSCMINSALSAQQITPTLSVGCVYPSRVSRFRVNINTLVSI